MRGCGCTYGCFAVTPRVYSRSGKGASAAHGTTPSELRQISVTTIEHSEVPSFKGRAIKRALELGHSTSVYSPILRRADLLTLQPNTDVRPHCYPVSRRGKVFQELRRPVFSLLDCGPLSESSTYLWYESWQSNHICLTCPTPCWGILRGKARTLNGGTLLSIAV